MSQSASPSAITHIDEAIPLVLVTQDHLIGTARALILERCSTIGPSNSNPALSPTPDEMEKILQIDAEIHLLDRFLSGALRIDWMHNTSTHPLRVEIAKHMAHLTELLNRTRPATEA